MVGVRAEGAKATAEVVMVEGAKELAEGVMAMAASRVAGNCIPGS